MALLQTLNILRTLDITSMFWFQHLDMYAEVYLNPCQTLEIDLLGKIVKGFMLSTIFANSFILDIWQGYEYASSICYNDTIGFSVYCCLYEKTCKNGVIRLQHD